MATGHNPLGFNAYLNTRPAAEVRPAETEQQMDIRLLKENYSTGKKALATCAEILLRIHKRGEWERDRLPWGKWCEEKLGIDRSHAYAMIRTKNTATEELKAYYRDQLSQAPVASSPTVAASTYTSSTPEPPKPKPEPKGPDSEEPPPTPRVRTENGKAKRDLAVWGEIRDYIGHAVNRLDMLNQHCPNPAMKKSVRADLDNARSNLDTWWNQTK